MTISLILSIIIWPFTSQQLQSHYHAQTNIPVLPELMQNKQWQEVKAPNWNWQPEFEGVVTKSLRYFKNKESIIGLYQANFGDEKQGAELINMQNVLIKTEDHNHWRFITQSSLTLSNQKTKKSINIDTTQLRGSSIDILTAKWYQLGKLKTNNPYLAKTYQLYKRLVQDMSPEIYCVIFTNQSKFQGTNSTPPVIQNFITQFVLSNE